MIWALPKGRALRTRFFVPIVSKRAQTIASIPNAKTNPMKIQEILEKLDFEKEFIGFQLSKKKGFINSTWLLYKKEGNYYFFDINQKVEFIDSYKYSKNEAIIEFGKSNFEIDLPIN
ncbi:MAG: hypothetical protein GY739_11610 [Mesoflavibacter sp.]|nr:hypothetical protein [Mesoflavibacter sp.]